MSYNPYAGDREPDGLTLQQYAESWVDMVPHVEQLKALASRAKVIVEFGLRGGVSTWSLLDGLPENGKLFGVDIDPDARLARRVREDPRFTFIVGDSVKVELPPKADLVMIDSSHEYEQTVLELDTAASLSPTVIALHDYLYEETPDVRRAVDEFVDSQEMYVFQTVHPSRWGLAILRRA